MFIRDSEITYRIYIAMDNSFDARDISLIFVCGTGYGTWSRVVGNVLWTFSVTPRGQLLFHFSGRLKFTYINIHIVDLSLSNIAFIPRKSEYCLDGIVTISGFVLTFPRYTDDEQIRAFPQTRRDIILPNDLKLVYKYLTRKRTRSATCRDGGTWHKKDYGDYLRVSNLQVRSISRCPAYISTRCCALR